MALDRPVTDYASVAAWREGLVRQWGDDVLAEDPAMTAALEEFCAFVGEDPDQIVAKLFRIRKSDGERVLSAKWRTHYADKIKEFRDRSAADGPTAEARSGRAKATAVAGFMIHNGVLIQV